MTIHHVALETRRVDAGAEIAFWALVGFAVVEPPASLRDRAAWLERDGRQVHLLYADHPTVPPAGHTAIVAADYDETLARLRNAGVAVDERTAHWGAARCLVVSPGGHRVEIMAAVP